MSHSQAATVQQLDALLDFLDDHRDLARGHLRCADGRERAKRLWEEATQILNSIGGSSKNVQQWQKVWTDRKHNAKKIAAANKRSAAATGGGPSEHVTLSPWEQRVLNIMGEGFGEPQTTASVPAFRQNWDFDEELSTYSVYQNSQPLLQISPPQSPSHSLICESSFQPPSISNQTSSFTLSSYPTPFVLQASSQPPLVAQASPRPLSAPRASSQRSQIARASSHSHFIPQVSSRSPLITQASSQSPLIVQVSSQSPLIAQASSQPPLSPQVSSQYPLNSQPSPPSASITQASPPPPLITQSSSETPVIPQASSSNQQGNNSAGRTRTRRRITSRRGVAVTDSLQDRFFGFEAKRLQLEQQKVAELRALRQQHAQLTSSLRGIPELTLTLRELTALMKEFITRQLQQ